MLTLARNTLGRSKCALFVLPYVSLCEQKAASLTKLLQPTGK